MSRQPDQDLDEALPVGGQGAGGGGGTNNNGGGAAAASSDDDLPLQLARDLKAGTRTARLPEPGGADLQRQLVIQGMVDDDPANHNAERSNTAEGAVDTGTTISGKDSNTGASPRYNNPNEATTELLVAVGISADANTSNNSSSSARCPPRPNPGAICVTPGEGGREAQQRRLAPGAISVTGGSNGSNEEGGGDVESGQSRVLTQSGWDSAMNITTATLVDEAGANEQQQPERMSSAEAVPLHGCCQMTLFGKVYDVRRGTVILLALLITAAAIAVGVTLGTQAPDGNNDQPPLAVPQDGDLSILYNQTQTLAPEEEDTEWLQLGEDVDGVWIGESFGWSVAISSDASRFASGSFRGGELGNGSVGVFEYDNPSDAWVQIGDTLYGDRTGSRLGWSVSMSADGNILAAGAPQDSSLNMTENGLVRAFQYHVNRNDTAKSGHWEQLGQDIAGDKDKEWFGYTVSLSSSGERMAVGSFLSSSIIEGTGNNASYSSSAPEVGRIQVFQLQQQEAIEASSSTSSRKWTPMGKPITGKYEYDRAGVCALSGNGNVVALGAVQKNNPGYVRAFEWNQEDQHWVQLGQDLSGENMGDYFGWGISLSDDGRRLAVGAIYHAGGGKTNGGQVRVYQFEEDYSQEDRSEGRGKWIQIGGDINADDIGDASGYAVPLSADGNTIAIGSRFYGEGDVGATRVFVLDESDNKTQWTQLGTAIEGEFDGDHSGAAVALSSDGVTVAIGARYNSDSNGTITKNGHVQVFTYSP